MLFHQWFTSARFRPDYRDQALIRILEHTAAAQDASLLSGAVASWNNSLRRDSVALVSDYFDRRAAPRLFDHAAFASAAQRASNNSPDSETRGTAAQMRDGVRSDLEPEKFRGRALPWRTSTALGRDDALLSVHSHRFGFAPR